VVGVIERRHPKGVTPKIRQRKLISVNLQGAKKGIQQELGVFFSVRREKQLKSRWKKCEITAI
jgi:hypothetical protein